VASSLVHAFKEAQMKKSKGKGQHSTGPIHPSFPPQGAPQPSFMGSQSAPPMQGSPMGMPTGGGGMPGMMPPGGDTEQQGGF